VYDEARISTWMLTARTWVRAPLLADAYGKVDT
jgi:hypothetical protein